VTATRNKVAKKIDMKIEIICPMKGIIPTITPTNVKIIPNTIKKNFSQL